MAQITLTAEETGAEVLPPVCVVCGTPAAGWVRVNFSWVPGWSYVFLLLGLCPWVVIYLVLRRSMEVEAHVCGRHRHHWLRRKLVLVTGLLLSLGMLVVTSEADPNGPPTWAVLTTAGLFLATIVAACWMYWNGVRATAVGRESVTLAGVAPEFVAAIESGRAEYARQRRQWLIRHD